MTARTEKTDYHVVRLPLRSNPREQSILDGQLQIVGSLRNASQRELNQRVDAMRADTEWLQARNLPKGKKNRAYRRLITRYQLTPFDANQLVLQHWRSSSWMGERIGSRIGLALATELHQNTMEWLYGRAEKPRLKHQARRNTVWNNDNKSGLLYRDGRITWSFKTKHKNLSLPVELAAWSNKRRLWLQDRTIARAGITREIVRGRERYFALLCIKGTPYRSSDYLDNVSSDWQGLDLGPSKAAIVNSGRGLIIELITAEELQTAREAAKHERRVKRALDRSRRAMNPEAFNLDGTSKRGVRQSKKSKRGRKREASLAKIRRNDAIHRKDKQLELTKEIVRNGKHVIAEDLDYRAWQSSGLKFGKRMGLTAPGQFMDLLKAECKRVSGELRTVDPWAYALSQYCICGNRVKKPLSQRVHECAECGFGRLHWHGPVDRDLFSAFLTREVVINDLRPEDLSDGLLNEDGFRKRASALCQVPERYYHSEEFSEPPSKQKYETGSRSPDAQSLRVEERPGSPLNATASKTASDPLSTCTGPRACVSDLIVGDAVEELPSENSSTRSHRPQSG